MVIVESGHCSSLLPATNMPSLSSADLALCLTGSDSTFHAACSPSRSTSPTLKPTQVKGDESPEEDTGKGPIKRTVFTRKQLASLETRFIQQSFLSKEERKELADSLELTERQVMIWFQNRRGRLKRRGANDTAYNPVKLDELHHRRPYPFLYGMLTQTAQYGSSMQQQAASMYPDGIGGALANAMTPAAPQSTTVSPPSVYPPVAPNVNFFAGNSMYNQQQHGYHQHAPQRSHPYSRWTSGAGSRVHHQQSMKTMPTADPRSPAAYYSCVDLERIQFPPSTATTTTTTSPTAHQQNRDCYLSPQNTSSSSSISLSPDSGSPMYSNLMGGGGGGSSSSSSSSPDCRFSSSQHAATVTSPLSSCSGQQPYYPNYTQYYTPAAAAAYHQQPSEYNMLHSTTHSYPNISSGSLPHSAHISSNMPSLEDFIIDKPYA